MILNFFIGFDVLSNCNGRDLDKKRSSIQTAKYAYVRRRSTAVY